MNQIQQQQNDQILENLSKQQDKNVLREWLKKNDISTTKNSRDQNLLHLIAINNNLVLLKLILKKKLVSLPNLGVFGVGSKNYELRNNNSNIEMIIDQKDNDLYTPLHCAINQGSFEIARKLLKKNSDANSRTSSGSTPLHLLSKFCYSNESIKLAKQLIECGAYINHKDGKQETPLHRATMLNDNFDYLKCLLYYGANPNIVNKRGRTCQHISIEQGKVELLELFLMYGADFNKATSMLPSPMEMAAISPFPQIKQFFLERISPTGENILMIEKSVFLGKPIPTFIINGDSYTTGNSTQLFTGKLYITNFRIVFKIDQSSSSSSSLSNNTQQFPLLDEEEESIPLLSILTLRTDDDKDNQSNNPNNTNNSNYNNNNNNNNINNSSISENETLTDSNNDNNNLIDDFLSNQSDNSIRDSISSSSSIQHSNNTTTTINLTNNNNSNFSAHFSLRDSNIINNIIGIGKNSNNITTTTTTATINNIPLSPIITPNNSKLNLQQQQQQQQQHQQIPTPSSTTTTTTTTDNNQNNIILNYQLINIETKDFKQFKLYFLSIYIRDKILELINYHFKDKIERAIKVNNQNKIIQKKIVKENIKMQDESKAEHIDRYESYGIFDETVPFLFSYLYKLPGFSNNSNSNSNNDNNYYNSIDGWKVYDQRKEYARFNIFSLNDDDGNSSGISNSNNNCLWRFTTINKDHKLSSSYPSSLVVLAKVTDKELKNIFSFRSKGRIPALSWRDPITNASISRCSQPLVGIGSSRCIEDELYCSNLALSAPSKTLYVIDARPKLNAIANTANGAGFENVHNYPNCKLVFMNIQNIHVIRKSLEKLSMAMKSSIRDKDHAESSDTRWWGYIEESGWISHIKSILEAAALTADLISKGNSVLVHCSDGWDRTSQISALSQILLDPFYRTIYGFQVLIEKEWISFGHKFSLRLGHLPGNEEERSPIFQQFLDCCFQLCNQFPLLFQFTPSLLLFISDNIHSCKYGTFLNNCEKERIKDQVRSKTISIWTIVNLNLSKFLNPYYNPSTLSTDGTNVIKPKLYSRCLELWKSCYMKFESKEFWMHSNWLLHNNSNFNLNNINNNNNNNQTTIINSNQLKNNVNDVNVDKNHDENVNQNHDDVNENHDENINQNHDVNENQNSNNISGSGSNWKTQSKNLEKQQSQLLGVHRPLKVN